MPKSEKRTEKTSDGVRRGTLRRLLVADLAAFSAFLIALVAVLYFLGLLDSVFAYFF